MTILKYIILKVRPNFAHKLSLVANFKFNFVAKSLRPAFTIVELLAVIVVIGVLTTITATTYSGVRQRVVSASLQSDLANAYRLINIYQVENDAFPASITDCPNPAPENTCIKSSTGNSYTFGSSNTASLSDFTITAINNSQIYSMSQSGAFLTGGRNLLAGDTSIEKTSTNEFAQYYDLAPIFDNYGIRQYTISFDIKSADISVRNTMNVYMQNGSGSRYTFMKTVPITTEYARQSVTVTPSLTSPGVVKSMLAFYGTYGTGNKPFVKNVKVELGTVATPWAQAP